MSETLWWVDDLEMAATDKPFAIEIAMERSKVLGRPVEIHECRSPVVSDIDADDIADTVWEKIDELIVEHETLSNEDGGPCLDPYCVGPDCRTGGNARISPRPPAWGRLRDAIRAVLDEHGDMSEASWVPTGVTEIVDAGGKSDG